jgi:ABC-type Co2+ transport system permease subunit
MQYLPHHLGQPNKSRCTPTTAVAAAAFAPLRTINLRCGGGLSCVTLVMAAKTRSHSGCGHVTPTI